MIWIWIAVLMIQTVGVCVGQASVPGPDGDRGAPAALDDPDAVDLGSEPSEYWSGGWPEEDLWPENQQQCAFGTSDST